MKQIPSLILGGLGLLLSLAPMFPAHADYSGHGSESVDPATIAKFAPPPIPSQVSRRIQTAMDLRAASPGMTSPDGKKLFFAWSVTGTSQIWRLDGPKRFPVQMTGGEDATSLVGITPDGRWIVVSRDRKGEENPGLYLQPSQGGALVEIQHKPKVQTSLSFVTQDSKFIFYRANDITPESYAIYRYEIATKKKELLFGDQPEHKGFWAVVDRNDESGGMPTKLLMVKLTGSVWREYWDFDIATRKLAPLMGQGERESYEAYYGPRPGELIVSTNKFSDFKSLYRFKDGKFTPVLAEMSLELNGFSIDRQRKRLFYSLNDRGYTKSKVMDARTGRGISFPEFKGADHVHFGTVSRNGRFMTFAVETATAPRTSYVMDWTTGKYEQWVIPSTPEVDTSKFAVATLESFPARDGTRIPMFVRRPPQCIDRGAQHRPCPVMVHLHGGPEDQSRPGFSPVFQLFVDAGIIVVDPNVRGSTGYGRKYLDADNGPKRLDVITDIEDVAKYIRSEWALNGRPPKIGVFGGSYGGYSVLMAMSRFAGAYDAGVAIVGMSNLVTFLNNTAPYRRPLRISEYGDPVADKEALEKLSPVTYLKQIKAPLLIIQGVSDPRVPAGEAIQIHSLLEKAKIPSQLILFADEGHGTVKRENRVLEFGHSLQFMEKHLKSGS